MNSKELLQKACISRATLNNYIGWGIVPKPQVLAPGPQDGDAPRIGYFPEDTVSRIAEIQRLKAQGWGMKRIAEHFGAPPSAPAGTSSPQLQAPHPVRAGGTEPVAGAVPATSHELTGRDPRRRPPVLTHVAILVSDLQNASRIWAELPPEEYFELINHIWVTADPIFRRHHGSHGKHAGDGLVCHFFPRPDSSYLWDVLATALEMQQAMRRVSKEWQLRKGWSTELYMNTGVNEGQEWLGSLKSASQPEFTALGNTIGRAVRISELSRCGAVWATKNLVARLTPAERQRLQYGVRRTGDNGHDVFVSSVFSKVDALADAAPGSGERLKEIARLPITEIVAIADVPGH